MPRLTDDQIRAGYDALRAQGFSARVSRRAMWAAALISEQDLRESLVRTATFPTMREQDAIDAARGATQGTWREPSCDS